MKQGIYREDSAGFWHWAHPVMLPPEEANRLADSEYPDCHVAPYHVYLKRCDPDAMGEALLRKRLGVPVVSILPEKGL